MVTSTLETALDALKQMEDKGLSAEMLTLSGSISKKEGERHSLSRTWTYYLVTSLRT